MNKYHSLFIPANLTLAKLSSTNDVTVMSVPTAAAGSKDTVVNSIAQTLVSSGKIKIRLIQE